MKRLFAALMILLAPLLAKGEILMSYSTHKIDRTPPVAKGPVKLVCRGCLGARDRVMRKLEEAGYTISDDAETKIDIGGHISVPEDGRAPLEWIGEVYGKGLPPIPPAIKQQGDNGDLSPGAPGRQLQFDAGVMRELSGVTSSPGGATVIAFGLNLLTNWYFKRQEDAKRTPGIARMFATITPSGGERMTFNVLLAATTPETPDALIDAGVDAVIQGLVNGVVPAKDDPKKGQPDGNAQQASASTPTTVQ